MKNAATGSVSPQFACWKLKEGRSLLTVEYNEMNSEFWVYHRRI